VSIESFFVSNISTLTSDRTRIFRISTLPFVPAYYCPSLFFNPALHFRFTLLALPLFLAFLEECPYRRVYALSICLFVFTIEFLLLFSGVFFLSSFLLCEYHQQRQQAFICSPFNSCPQTSARRKVSHPLPPIFLFPNVNIGLRGDNKK